MVTNEQIVREWFKHDTLAGVAKALGLSKATLSTRSCILRSAGVKLPKKCRREVIDTDELNRIIDTLGPPLNGSPPKAEPPAVSASGESGQLLRTRLLVDSLHRRSPQHIAQLAKSCGMTLTSAQVLTKQKYFDVQDDRVSLTPAAQLDFLGKK